MTVVKMELAAGWKTRLAALGLPIPTVVLGTANDPPDAVIIVTPYLLSEAVAWGTGPARAPQPGDIYGVQVRIRGTATGGDGPVYTTQQAIRNAMHGLTDQPFGAVQVALTWRQTDTNLAPDEQGRPEITDSYWHTGLTLPPT